MRLLPQLPSPRIPSFSTKLVLMAGLAALLAIGAWPVFGESVQRWVVPREVSSLPGSVVASEQRSLRRQQPTPSADPLPLLGATPAALPVPTPRSGLDRAELQRQAGFPVVEPTWLPPGCQPVEASVDAAGQIFVNLTYSCLHVVEHVVHSVQRPYVGAGSTQEVTVSGQPAVYVDGSWTQVLGKNAAPQWRSGLSQLLFVRDNVLFILDGPRGQQLSKDDLIHTAESLR